MRRWPWKRIGWVAAIALAAYVTIGIILAGRDTPPIPPTMQAINLRGGHVRGNHITTHSWSFDYDTANLSPDGITGSINGVHHGVIFKHGKPYMKISAEHVSINTQTLDFTALGKVSIARIGDSQKRSFDTDLVEWTNSTKMLLLPHPCYVHSGGQLLRISHITVDFATDDIHFGKIEGSVQLKK